MKSFRHHDITARVVTAVIVVWAFLALAVTPLHASQPSSTFAINKSAVWLGFLFTLSTAIGMLALALNIRKRRRVEEMLSLKIDEYQQSQEELLATEEMLRAQVDEYIQSQEELQATEEMLREQIGEYRTIHDQLLVTEEMLRVQLEVVEESSTKFKAVFENSPITVALTTLPEGTFSEVNQSFVDMFGYTRDEAIGKTTVELGLWLHESDRNRYLQLLRENRFVSNFEAKMRHKGGEEIAVLFSGTLLEIAGKPFTLSAVMDISEQKRLQNQLLQAQKMDVVGQLAGGIAHDFNNMLAGIMASAELLKLRLPRDDKNSRLVDTIIEAATRSADMTRELLTFSRKESAVSRPVHINDTIAAVMSLLERTIDKHIHLTSRLVGGNPVVMGDHTQLQNALLNLGVNARDAMPQGGVLTYSTTAKTMDVAAFQSLGITLAPGRYLEISVSDSGAGMTKAVMEHIFEPFFTTKRVGKGTGLGLAAVYGTVKIHHGELYVRSEPGAGSVFNIYLPMMEEADVTPLFDGEIVAGKGGVLLVDDEEILREVGRDLLENLGYTVYLAENGAEALDVFARHRHDISLVMLDMIMPKMGGKEAFVRLREQAPELKVLFCSGFSNEGTGDELLSLGASGFIRKPFNRIDLSRAVAEAWGTLNAIITSAQQPAVLVVEDERYVRESLTAYLDDIGFRVVAAENGRIGLELFRSEAPDIVMTDLRMPEMDGFALVEAIAAESEFTPIVVVSGVGAVDEAVRAMRLGAWDYVSKPIVNFEELQITLDRSLERARTKYELERLRRHLSDGTLGDETAFSGIITTSPRMRAIFLYLESVAPSRHPVLISGETGTGKELIARAVHTLSGLKGPFVTINLAGLDDAMFSDTLFGHLRGAYTGADRVREGLVRQASGGTLFLDEIGDMSPGSQVKLLRLLQQGEYMPLGADKVLRSDARIVAATHADLKVKMDQGLFRPDLYYRLCSHRVELPPLRDRPEDIPLLAAHFLEKAAAQLGKATPAAPAELNRYLTSYRFPGNIRELEALIHDAVARSGSRILPLESIVTAIGGDLRSSKSDSPVVDKCPLCPFREKFPTLKEAEDLLIFEALRLADNNQRLAATYLGITRQALNKRLSRSGPFAN